MGMFYDSGLSLEVNISPPVKTRTELTRRREEKTTMYHDKRCLLLFKGRPPSAGMRNTNADTWMHLDVLSAFLSFHMIFIIVYFINN